MIRVFGLPWRLLALFFVLVALGGCRPKPAQQPAVAEQLPMPVPADTAATITVGAEIHSVHCLLGCPMGAPDTNDLLFRHAYTMSTNDATKFADWVAYVVDTTSVRPLHETGRNWATDDWLDPSETLEEDDYRGANAALGTDRGHQAPLASFRGTTYWSETNILSNITPQRAALNQGPWVRIETLERDMAEAGNTVYVLTGPLYERDMPPLPEADEPHRVPSGFWKVITVVSPVGNATLLDHRAYIMDQEAERAADPETMRVTIEDIERRSGLDLFPGQ